jgi:hypothetical protein
LTKSARVDTDVRAMNVAEGRDVTARAGLAVPVRAGLWVAGLLLALWMAFSWGQTTSVHNDFAQNVWLPARLLLDGANPYHPTRAQVDMALGQYSGEFKEFNSGSDFAFIYPVWVAALFSPFGAIPLVVANAIWRALNALLLVWALGSLLRSSSPAFRSLKAPAIAATVVTVVLSLIYRESILTLYLGQFSILELGMLAAIWGWLISSQDMSTEKRRVGDLLTGVAMAALATKPQAVGLVVVLLGLWALSRRRFLIPASAVFTLAALLLVPMLVYPWSLTDWLRVVAGGQASSQVTVSASVWGVSYQWLGANSPWGLVALVLTLVGLGALMPRWWRDLRDKRSPLPMSLPLTICVNSVISPYMLGYEHILLLLPAMVFVAAAGPSGMEEGDPEPWLQRSRKYWRLAMYTWIAVVPFLIVAVQGVLNGKEYPVIVQSLSMLAICWIARPEWVSVSNKSNNQERLPFPNGGGGSAL